MKNVSNGEISGKAKDADQNVINNGLKNVWPIISNGYVEDNVFNANEAGIYFKL